MKPVDKNDPEFTPFKTPTFDELSEIEKEDYLKAPKHSYKDLIKPEEGIDVVGKREESSILNNIVIEATKFLFPITYKKRLLCQ